MKKKIVLLLALVMGILTTVLFFRYIDSLRGEKEEESISVVVAKEDIKENQTITAEIVQMVEMPKKGVHESAVKQVAQAEGRFALSPIKSGEVILSHHIKRADEEKRVVSKKVRKGYRAVSVGSDFIQSVSNLIEPGDKVDVVITENVKNEGNDASRTIMFLENAHVLAVGRKLTRLKEGEEYKEYSSVTLEVKPDEAISLIDITQKGRIHFLLNPASEEQEGGK
jgi:pilus assembly protein CpaB